MRRSVEYKWKSRPLCCKLGLHKCGRCERTDGGSVLYCTACPYYWYV